MVHGDQCHTDCTSDIVMGGDGYFFLQVFLECRDNRFIESNSPLKENVFTNMFAGMLSEALPENFAAFTNTNGSFEVIVSVIMVPLTALERPVVDLYLRDTQRLANDFSSAGGITGLTNDESSQPVGEASSSVIFGVQDAALKMNGGMTVTRRGEALQIALLFYPDGTQPALASYAVAEIVDGKLAELE